MTKGTSGKSFVDILRPFTIMTAVSVVVLAVFVTTVVQRIYWPVASGSDLTHPSDSSLESVFASHEAEFQELVSMSNTDSKVIRIAPDFTWLDNNVNWPRPDSELGFTKERWDKYRVLFARLGIDQGLERYESEGEVHFTASSFGMLEDGTSKGYVYSIKEMSPIYVSLDGPLTNAPSGLVYKKIKRHWYLYLYRKKRFIHAGRTFGLCQPADSKRDID